MIDFQKMYQEKLSTAEELSARIGDGWVIGTDAAAAYPVALLTALTERARQDAVKGVTIQTLLDVYPLAFYADQSLYGKITGQSWFSSAGARKAINGGWADYIPNYYRDTPAHILNNYEYDLFCVEVSPMDKHGYFSLGTVSSYSAAMIAKARHIFVEVNDRQPRAVCGAQLHISQVDGILEFNHELPVLPAAKLDEVSVTIGNLIAEQIPDGACIQLGIGAIPDATGMALKAKHDLASTRRCLPTPWWN